MAIRNPQLEQLRRLELKSLQSQFLTIVRDGLNCSPFEGEAVLQVVEEVFFPFLDDEVDTGNLPPGRTSLVVVQADEPAGKPLRDCEKITITLTVHRGAEDDGLLLKEGPAAFRRARLPDLCQQALSRGGLLTREDLAYRIFFVSPRTISRDLKKLREADPDTLLPLRSNKHDIGPVLTHRVRIVELALEGKTYTQIRDIMRHSPEAIANYLGVFTRCAQLQRSGMQIGQIAFLLRRGKRLIQRYIQLLKSCDGDKNRSYHLNEMLLADGRGWRGRDEKKASHQNNPKP